MWCHLADGRINCFICILQEYQLDHFNSVSLCAVQCSICRQPHLEWENAHCRIHIKFILQCPVHPTKPYHHFFLCNRGSPLTLSVWMTAQPDGCKSSASNLMPTRLNWSLSMVRKIFASACVTPQVCLFQVLMYCVMFQVPVTRHCWFQTVRGPWTTSCTAAPSHESWLTSHHTKVSLSLNASRMLKEIVIKVQLRSCVWLYVVEPICAVGQGVAALCCATEEQKWIFNGYSMTGVCAHFYPS